MKFLEKLVATVRRHTWFMVGVVLPVLISAVYLFLIASPLYVSESRFVVRSPSERSIPTTGLAGLIQTTGFGGGQDQSSQVIDYVRSRSALEALQEKISVRDAYGDASLDFLSAFPRIWESDTFEDLFDYYRTKVEISRDTDTGTVVLRALAFNPEEAAIINETLLLESEDLVNRLNENAQTNAIAEAASRVIEAEKRVAEAREAIAAYRNSAAVVDPLTEATGIASIANRLITERAGLEAQLSTLRSVTPQNPSIPALQEQIASLTREINRQTARLTGGRGTISSKLPSYDALVLEQKLSSELLILAQTALENARSEALKKQFYLERVVNPNTPDQAAYPRPLRTILIILGFAVCIYFIVWMFVVGILEHSPED